MLSQIGMLLAETIFGLLVYLALLRFFMQVMRAPFRNPIGQFVQAFTDWAVKPLRKMVPGWRGYDLSSLVFAFLMQLALVAIVHVVLMPGRAGAGGLEIIALTFIGLIRACLYLVIGVVLADVVISWVNPQSPFAPFLRAITNPLYAVFRRFIPPIGGFDLSPLVLLLVVQILLLVLANGQIAIMRAL